tara:strand:+ start:4559 stop:5575 length:1017 start_codon:yes stop_codon:yes gene_type:complete
MVEINQKITKKVLVIRFSSIGDIVLTSPIVRCLKISGFEVHFVVKGKFKNAIENNKNINKLFTLEERDLKERLLNRQYDLVIDLQNNIKSLRLRKGLSKTIRVVNKENIKKLLLVRLGVDLLNNQHIVERYFKALDDLGVKNDGKGLDFYIPDNFNLENKSIPLDLSKPYIAWVIGASYPKKKLPIDHVIKTCNKIKIPIAIVGDQSDEANGIEITNSVEHPNIYNLCGKLSLMESSFVLKKAAIVLSNDTGLMHIASAFNKKIISFWGCTKPSLGMFPYKPLNGSLEIVSKTHHAPCSKLGNRCKSKNKNCIEDIQPAIILATVNRLLETKKDTNLT